MDLGHGMVSERSGRRDPCVARRPGTGSRLIAFPRLTWRFIGSRSGRCTGKRWLLYADRPGSRSNYGNA